MLFIYKGSSGFSLTEVMVAMGIVGVTAYFSADLLNYISKRQFYASALTTRNEIFSDMGRYVRTNEILNESASVAHRPKNLPFYNCLPTPQPVSVPSPAPSPVPQPSAIPSAGPCLTTQNQDLKIFLPNINTQVSGPSSAPVRYSVSGKPGCSPASEQCPFEVVTKFTPQGGTTPPQLISITYSVGVEAGVQSTHGLKSLQVKEGSVIVSPFDIRNTRRATSPTNGSNPGPDPGEWVGPPAFNSRTATLISTQLGAVGRTMTSSPDGNYFRRLNPIQELPGAKTSLSFSGPSPVLTPENCTQWSTPSWCTQAGCSPWVWSNNACYAPQSSPTRMTRYTLQADGRCYQCVATISSYSNNFCDNAGVSSSIKCWLSNNQEIHEVHVSKSVLPPAAPTINIPNCSRGQVLTASGGSLYCTTVNTVVTGPQCSQSCPSGKQWVGCNGSQPVCNPIATPTPTPSIVGSTQCSVPANGGSCNLNCNIFFQKSCAAVCPAGQTIQFTGPTTVRILNTFADFTCTGSRDPNAPFRGGCDCGQAQVFGYPPNKASTAVTCLFNCLR
jgi:prepilin-type N-terminal cleavage/methylation domain-containing protein